MAYRISVCILASLTHLALGDTGTEASLALGTKAASPSLAHAMDIPSMSFRLGSGASGYQSSGPLPGRGPKASVEAERPKPEPPARPVPQIFKKSFVLVNPIILLGILFLMMPAGQPNLTGGSRDFNYRIPPAWSPENESSYSFRAYMTDISILDHADRPPAPPAVRSNCDATWWSSTRDGTHDFTPGDDEWWHPERHPG